MAQIYLCFLWHMHQPFYKDLISGEYKLPWTRLHALKDYYGMVQILEEFPSVHQTFNLVPSMLVQVEEYAAGTAFDPYLQAALKPAEELSAAEQDFILENFFHANIERLIYRYPRYGELFDAWRAQRGLVRSRSIFGSQEFRDLQVLSQVAWFDEEFLENDPEVRGLVEKGRDFSSADQRLMARKQREILGMVIPAYRRMAGSGQIEISTTPFYHPILPLLCDSDIAGVSHPGVPLPQRFQFPQDARRQLEMSREFLARRFGIDGVGLWPSEGSVSDETFTIAAELGFRWAATDSGVLSRTLGRGIGVESIYRPYCWVRGGHEIRVLFRDHFLSDLIGFVYSRMGAPEAAEDFLQRIRENCRAILSTGRDALVPIILDGENAWEYYYRNGRPFLRELYRRISDDRHMQALTISEALARIPCETSGHIFPGSWINANFDVWIGAEEDNRAWDQLLRARQTYDLAIDVPADRRQLAFEELLIAEGSDWCWWYGPEHDSAQRPEFDRLYRAHLANVYRALGRTPPDELSRPILKMTIGELHIDPTGPIRPVIDGEITSYFEWIGAGTYRVDDRSGAMHGRKTIVQEVFYGSDGHNLFIRVDLHPGTEQMMEGMEARFNVQHSSATIHFEHGRAHATDLKLVATAESGVRPVECAFQKILEIRLSLAAVGVVPGGALRFQFSLWQGGLPLDAVPQHGWLEMPTTDPEELAR